MKIFSKRAFKFKIMDGKEEKIFITKAMDFSSAPEWIKNTTLFQLAVKDRLIVESGKALKGLENDGVDPEEAALRMYAKTLGISNVHNTGMVKLKAKIAEKEAEIEALRSGKEKPKDFTQGTDLPDKDDPDEDNPDEDDLDEEDPNEDDKDEANETVDDVQESML